MEPIAKVLFCWMHPLDWECKWSYSLEWYNSPFGDYGRERKMLCLSPHHICESHKKGKGFNSHSWCCLLKGISPSDSHTETPRGSLTLSNMQRHATLCFHLMRVTQIKMLQPSLWSWNHGYSHLKVQLNCLKGKPYYWCEACQIELSAKCLLTFSPEGCLSLVIRSCFVEEFGDGGGGSLLLCCGLFFTYEQNIWSLHK